MRGRRSHSGNRTTTKRVRTAACSTVPQWSSQRRLRACTEMKWGKRPQTPAPCPTPPSPLRRKACGANKNQRKSHYPWTKDGGQVMTVLISLSSSSVGQSLSMTVDFDGSGFGTFHSSSSVPSFSTRCVTCTGTLSLPSGSSQGTDQQVRDFQAARLDEQRQQERLRHEAE